ncbi:MAG: ribF [Clostridia bacterium]|nr:ribF [Clostridia bacterium]
MSVIAIGNFDGVHKGHALVLKNAVKAAQESNTKSIVLTFNEHPRNVLSKKTTIKYLTDNEYKEKLIKAFGINEVEFIDFNESFAEQTSTEFIKFLKDSYDCTTVVCGSNFKFGKKAVYNTESLKVETKKQGLNVIITDMVVNGLVISSTEIRGLIENGDITTANKLLDRDFSISGLVVHGKHLGSTIGFPTINQFIPESFIIPRIGVYATYAEINGRHFKGVTNVGHRPTVDSTDSAINVETHLLDNNEDYYGKDIRVFFIKRIRDEIKFNSLDLLKKQLTLDCEYVRKI